VITIITIAIKLGQEVEGWMDWFIACEGCAFLCLEKTSHEADKKIKLLCNYPQIICSTFIYPMLVVEFFLALPPQTYESSLEKISFQVEYI
jgi:hypothetical protein